MRPPMSAGPISRNVSADIVVCMSGACAVAEVSKLVIRTAMTRLALRARRRRVLGVCIGRSGLENQVMGSLEYSAAQPTH